MSIALSRLVDWLNLLHSEVEAFTNDEVPIEKVCAGTYDCLCCPSNHLEHLSLRNRDHSNVIVFERFKGQTRRIFFDKDQIGTQTFNFILYDLHESFLLFVFRVNVNITIFFLHITQRVVQKKDLRVLYLSSHAPTSHIFLENYTIYILALFLVLMLNRHNFDK